VQYAHSLYAGSFPFATHTSVSAADGAVARHTHYFHADHLGSIMAVPDEAGLA
jgi:hypothetical protein